MSTKQVGDTVPLLLRRSCLSSLEFRPKHFLLQKSHPDSVILLLYTNRPCIVIGRNQNPWVEVNLGLVNQRGILKRLRAGSTSVAAGERTSSVGEDNDVDDVLLVRRRSGGGTVFHDAGNVNYSVICPPASFDRNKHAEMVVRALRGLRKTPHGVRVNERHDIVLDVSPHSEAIKSHERDTGMNSGDVRTFKISGSAYKLTRTRSLHHGTCLLSSPHLPFLSQLLRSPAAPYIKARGVESVRSPVRNVGISNADFEDAVVAEFVTMYDGSRAEYKGNEKMKVDIEIIDAGKVEHIPEIQAGVAELRSRDWIYAQTPQFTFSSHPTADDPRPRPDLPADLPSSFFPTDPELSSADLADANAPGLQMTVRHAEITDLSIPSTESGNSDSIITGAVGDKSLVRSLKGLHLHHIDDWRTHLGSENESVGRWLNRLFGVKS
ncbi:hypothetical protein EKO27_g5728 [Xylaria grammica]|uniref:Putative lipoate-protein ligase A n=1 Tax=Xylaria grammica TaxID=363999 RepID=A0A439D4Q1_9PEZI|nr:hypothetical protein EKO27_g5728 [Xylaria grammica]